MNLLSRLTVLVLLSVAWAGVAGAQTSPLTVGNSVSLDGLTATITALTCPMSGCSSGDELTVVALSKDNIQFEVVNSTAGSAIFTSPTGSTQTVTETFKVTLSIGATVGYHHAIGTPSAVTQVASGWQGYSSCSNCSSESATASSAFTGSTLGTTPLVDTLAKQGSGTTTKTLQTITSSADAVSVAASPFVIASTLSLVNSGQTATNLQFNSIALQLKTVPEPASIIILATAVAGVATSRRRHARKHAGIAGHHEAHAL